VQVGSAGLVLGGPQGHGPENPRQQEDLKRLLGLVVLHLSQPGEGHAAHCGREWKFTVNRLRDRHLEDKQTMALPPASDLCS